MSHRSTEAGNCLLHNETRKGGKSHGLPGKHHGDMRWRLRNTGMGIASDVHSVRDEMREVVVRNGDEDIEALAKAVGVLRENNVG